MEEKIGGKMERPEMRGEVRLIKAKFYSIAQLPARNASHIVCHHGIVSEREEKRTDRTAALFQLGKGIKSGMVA